MYCIKLIFKSESCPILDKSDPICVPPWQLKSPQVAVIPPPSSSPVATTSTDGAAHHVTFDLTPGYLYSSQVAADVHQTGSGEETISPNTQLSGLLLDRSLFNL